METIKTIKTEFEKHVKSYVTDLLKGLNRQEVLDKIDDNLSAIENQRKAHDEQIRQNKVAFANYFKTMTAGIINLNAATNTYVSAEDIQKHIDALNFIEEIFTNLRKEISSGKELSVADELVNVIKKITK